MEPVLALERCRGRSVIIGILGVLFATVLFATGALTSSAYADTSHCGTIGADQTWSSAGNAHTVDCNVTVDPGVTLTVTQGTIVQFASAKKLTVNGTLVALGTAGEPITMTAKTATPSAGYWQGLYFESGSTVRLEHVTVEYAGDYDYAPPTNNCVEIASNDVSLSHVTIRYCASSIGVSTGVYAGGDVTIDSSTISDCTGYGVHAAGAITLTNSIVNDNGDYPLRISATNISATEFTGTTFVGNSPDAISAAGATLVGDHIWPPFLSQQPVHVDSLTVGDGGALTLSPGTALHFAATKGFQVDGTLTALGTASEPITMTANTATPVAGFWQGLLFNDGSAGDLDHVTVEYGGHYDYGSEAPFETGVEIHSSDVSLSNTTILHSEGTGLYSTTSMTLTGSVINHSSGYPVRIPASVIGDSQMAANSFSGNGEDALSVGSSTVTGNHTWPLWMAEYPVHIDSLAVGSSGALTLPAGISLHFPEGTAFNVDGTLTALGTASAPITMTANSTAPVAGFWQGLLFNDGSVGDLDHVTVEYGGYYDYGTEAPFETGVEIHSSDVSLTHATIADCQGIGVYASTSTSLVSSKVTGCSADGVRAGGIITLTDTVVSDNGGYPLRISAAAIGMSEFTGTTFSNNSPNAIFVIGAELVGSHSWPALFAELPVHVDWLRVMSSADLTLPPGVGLYFAATKAFEVNGTLTARGTVTEPITMTARSATPTAGFWQGLYFNSGSAGDLDYVTVEYAGDYDYDPPTNNCVEIASNDVSLSHVTVRYCASSIGVSTGIYAGGDVTIESSTVSDCTGYGVYAGGAITLTDSIINDNDDYPLRISAENISASEFTGTTFAGNSPDAVYAAGATLAGSHTWPAWLAQYPVHIGGDELEVGSGADLTLPPGVGLYFAATTAFEVDGTLTALGTVSKPITMTARSSTPVAGFWQGLYFNSGSAGDLDYVTVEYAGDYDYVPPTNNCVEIASNDVSLSHLTVRYCASSIGVSTGIYAGGDVTIESSTVSGCTGYGVYAGGAITLTDSIINDNDDYPLRISAENIGASEFTGTTFAGNSPDAVYAAGATLAGSHTWPAWLAQYPVHLDWLTVDSDAALTLPAGAALHLGEQEAFEVYGALLARGTPTMPITMTVNSSTPTAGSWQGLYLRGSSSGVLKHVTVEYAGDYDYTEEPSETGVELHTGNVSVSHVTVQHNAGSGLYVKTDTLLDHMLIQHNIPEGLRVANASVLVENSIIRDNSKGAFVRDADVTIVDSLIYNNSVYGVQNDSPPPSPEVMATHNWWGDPSGPYHPDTNPGGLGDEVSDRVIYRPWRIVGTRPLDLGVIKTGDRDPVMVHTNLTYTLVISNSGPDAAPGVIMTDSLPASVTYASSTASHGSCNGTAPVVCTWDLITASESVTVTIVVTAEEVGPITNVVTMSTLAPDTHDGNNDASETTLVVRNTDLSYIFLPLVLRR